MSIVAGIALSRVAGDAPLALTLASGTPKEPVFTKTSNYGMQSQDIDNIASTLSGIPELSTRQPTRLSVPIALKRTSKESIERTVSASIGSEVHCTDHLVSLVHLNDGSAILDDGKERNILFVDITPGQEAAKLAHTEQDDDNWVILQDELTVLEETSGHKLSAKDVQEKLVTPTVSLSSALHKIYLYSADETTSNDISSGLQSLFPQTPVVWATLADISRGAAKANLGNTTVKQHLLIDVSATMPISVLASNGNQVITVPRNYAIPTRQTSVFTTSKDNQTSVTLQIVVGRTPKDKIVLEGIAPKPKGVPRVQVTFDINMDANAVVSVEETASGVKKEVRIPSVFGLNAQESEEYAVNELPNDRRKTSENENEVVGELPE